MAGADACITPTSIRTSPVKPVEPLYTLSYAGHAIPLRAGETIIGRGDGADVSIDSPGVSRRHARIVVTASEVTIEDLGSRNGTWVAEERIDRAQEIVESSLIRIGPVWFLLQSVEVR